MEDRIQNEQIKNKTKSINKLKNRKQKKNKT